MILIRFPYAHRKTRRKTALKERGTLLFNKDSNYDTPPHCITKKPQNFISPHIPAHAFC